MKTIIILSLTCLLVMQLIAQTSKDADRKELHDLLDDRKKKFDDYSVSLEKHSGIFGNKTKNDIKTSNEVLIDIVKTDNRIISTLYRVVDFRTFEKVNMNYDLQKRQDLVANLEHATDTLSKQVDLLKSTNRSLQTRTTRLQWLLYILSALAIWRVVAQWRKNASQIES